MKLSLSCHGSRAALHRRVAAAPLRRHADLAIRARSSVVEQESPIVNYQSRELQVRALLRRLSTYFVSSRHVLRLGYQMVAGRLTAACSRRQQTCRWFCRYLPNRYNLGRWHIRLPELKGNRNDYTILNRDRLGRDHRSGRGAAQRDVGNEIDDTTVWSIKMQ